MRSLPLSQSSFSEEVCPSGPLRVSKPPSPATNRLEDDLLTSVPDCLKEILSTTTSPHADYLTLQLSRERRFRRLLRRFTNQIQYGCKNPRCEVPSCLSYRKRVSSTPIRPYSDVAARALAWKCVEQYANSGKELDFAGNDPFPQTHKLKSKGKIASRRDDLCRDEPVVPWYEDPKEYFRKRDAAFQSRSFQRSKQGDIACSNSERDQTGRKKNLSEAHPTPISETDASHHRVAENSGPRGDKVNHLTSSCTGLVVEDQGRRNDISKTKSEEAQRRDPASFTQFLFNTLQVNSFSHGCIPNHEENESQFPASQIPLHSEVDRSSLSQNPQQAEYSLTGTIPPFQTFRILPASAVLWLKRKLCSEPNSFSMQNFAQQSLHFALSHPLRLMESASTWDWLWENGRKEEPSNVWDPDGSLDDQVKSLSDMQAAGQNPFQAFLPSWDSVERTSLTLKGICTGDAVTTLSNHVFAALQHSYVTPAHSKTVQHCGLENPGASAPQGQSLTDRQVSHLVFLSMSMVTALATSVSGSSDSLDIHDYSQFQVIHPSSFLAARGTGQVYPQSAILQMYRHLSEGTRKAMCKDYLRLTFCNDDPNYLRFSDSVADIISHRLALSEMLMTADSSRRKSSNTNIVDETISFLLRPPVFIKDEARFITMHYSLRLLMLMQSVLLARWDRRPIVSRMGPVSGALQMLAGLYRKRQELHFESAYFQMHFVANDLDEVDMPHEWLAFRKNGKKMHILQFSFLFDPATLVKYFRAINLKVMQHAHENALAVYINAKSYLIHTLLPVYGVREILDKVRPHMARYFVMTISRHNILEDAINQIWRRERQELMRPLKVRVGKDEGEDGLDHGGVQQEFFRLVFAQAFNPDLGMFTIDETTRMAWFQPGSLEPLYKFESLGVLMSLAVYNAVTLPLTLPLAFYRKLLDLKVAQIQHVEDGWPELSRSLRTLLDWQDGDVGDAIMRTYEFSFDAYGSVVTIDMQKVARDDQWPTLERKKSRGSVKTASFKFPPSPLGTPPTVDSPSLRPELMAPKTSVPDTKGTSTPLSLESEDNEADLVTNANRRQYVKDYIFWLTDKSIRPQFEAFAKGFFTCLNPIALSIFTPEALKQVVEGHQDIDIDGLEKTATYDDYEADDPIIRDFWRVVRDCSPEQHRKLLEFVTASDRVPVNGIESITFTIQKNGEGDDRLPSSSTCYGRLLLPHYSSKEILKTKIEKAIENSQGFGSL